MSGFTSRPGNTSQPRAALGRRTLLSPNTNAHRTSNPYGLHTTNTDILGGPGGGGGSAGAGTNGGALFGNNSNSHAREQLNPDQIKEIEDAFSMFDADQDDLLDYHECRVAMRALGFDVPKSELLKIMRDAQQAVAGSGAAVGKHGAGQMPLMRRDIFVRIMTEKMMHRNPADEVRRAFVLFSGGEDQLIDFEKLERVAKELNENIDPSELQAMIEEFDLDDDGMINMEEFAHIMRDD